MILHIAIVSPLLPIIADAVVAAGADADLDADADAESIIAYRLHIVA